MFDGLVLVLDRIVLEPELVRGPRTQCPLARGLELNLRQRLLLQFRDHRLLLRRHELTGTGRKIALNAERSRTPPRTLLLSFPAIVASRPLPRSAQIGIT